MVKKIVIIWLCFIVCDFASCFSCSCHDEYCNPKILSIPNDGRDSTCPSLVWTGSEFAVVWREITNDKVEIYFARTDSTGTKIGSNVRITNDTLYSEHPFLVWTGSEFAVVWDEYEDGNANANIYFARIDSSGTKIGNNMRIINDEEDSLYPSLVWTGSEFAMAWQKIINNKSVIFFARMDSTGTKIGSDVMITSDSRDSGHPSFVWTGSEFAIAWEDWKGGNGEIYFARIDSTGTKIDSDVRVTDDGRYSLYPSLVWTGSEFAVAWEDNKDGNHEIYFVQITSAGIKMGSNVRVTNSEGYSGKPSLVWTGSEFAVAWYDTKDGFNEIYFTRIGCGH